MFDQILHLATAMTSPNPKEAEVLEAMCRCAEAEALARLPRGMDPAACGTAFPCAASLLATADLIASRMDAMDTRFTAGDVSIATQGGYRAAKLLRQRAYEILAILSGDTGFAFQGVRG